MSKLEREYKNVISLFSKVFGEKDTNKVYHYMILLIYENHRKGACILLDQYHQWDNFPSTCQITSDA